MTSPDVGYEVWGLTFGGLQMYRLTRAGGDDEFPAGRDHRARLQLDDDETSVGRDRPDDSNPL